MAGTTAPIELNRARRGGVCFGLAAPQDDAEIRRLLRENPMQGPVRISLEREPDANLSATVEGDWHQTIIARNGNDGPIIAMGSVVERTRYVDGQPERVAYLGQLRVDHAFRSKRSIIRDGYTAFRELKQHRGTSLYFTSIASQNTAARRLLERNLPGMPLYRPVCEYVTLIVRIGRSGGFQSVKAGVRRQLRSKGMELRHGSAELMPALVELLKRDGSRYQLAPVWEGSELESIENYGLRPSQFRTVLQAGVPIACAAVWDQRGMKQSVVRGYSTSLRWSRISLNLLSPITRLPYLPPIGQPIRSAFISHLAVPVNQPDLTDPLIRSLHGSAATLGVDCLMLGFDARDPRLAELRRCFGGREYRTQLYLVYWPEDAAAAEAVDINRHFAPEVALL